MNLGAVGCRQGMMQCLRKKARVGQMKLCSYIDNDPLNDSGQKDVGYGMCNGHYNRKPDLGD